MPVRMAEGISAYCPKGGSRQGGPFSAMCSCCKSSSPSKMPGGQLVLSPSKPVTTVLSRNNFVVFWKRFAGRTLKPVALAPKMDRNSSCVLVSKSPAGSSAQLPLFAAENSTKSTKSCKSVAGSVVKVLPSISSETNFVRPFKASASKAEISLEERSRPSKLTNLLKVLLGIDVKVLALKSRTSTVSGKSFTKVCSSASVSPTPWQVTTVVLPAAGSHLHLLLGPQAAPLT
mmetsp:Transcript_16702/g.28423  ORF Transcript_16702/g.28423 Transcript_16702/m.28423 type:complete len:231 (-) Transcript_16702:2598-3290(-)